MKRISIWKPLAFFLLLAALCFIPATAASAAGLQEPEIFLEPNITYRDYDVTGDWMNDTIRIKTTRKKGRYNSLTVTINGQKVYRIKNKAFDKVNAAVYTLSNGKPFLYIYAKANSGKDPVCGIFKFYAGKLKQIVNFQTLMERYGSRQYGEVIRVSNKRLETRVYFNSYSTGSSAVRYDFYYNEGNLKRTSQLGYYYNAATGEPEALQLAANKKIPAYASPTKNKKAFSIQKGNEVLVHKCWVRGKKMSLLVTVKDKTGWVRADDQLPKKAKDKQFCIG